MGSFILSRPTPHDRSTRSCISYSHHHLLRLVSLGCRAQKSLAATVACERGVEPSLSETQTLRSNLRPLARPSLEPMRCYDCLSLRNRGV